MVMAAKLGSSIIHILEYSIFKRRKNSFLDVTQNENFIFMDVLYYLMGQNTSVQHGFEMSNLKTGILK